jgi:group I intron endonuclease
MGYIYKITNTTNGKMYIGATINKDPNLRWLGHKSKIRSGSGCPLLRQAFEKYGENAFRFEVLIICFDENVVAIEKEYIKKYNTLTPNGYNFVEGGQKGGTFIGKKHTEETKEKLRQKSKEYNNRPEVKERSRKNAIQYNKTHNIAELQRKSEKWRKALEEGRVGCGKGNHHTEEMKQKISKSVKAYFEKNGTTHIKLNIEKHRETMARAKGIKVHQYSLNNEHIATFDSIASASRSTSIPKSTIQVCISSNRKTKIAGGYIWKSVKEEEEEEVQSV